MVARKSISAMREPIDSQDIIEQLMEGGQRPLTQKEAALYCNPSLAVGEMRVLADRRLY